MTNNPCRELMLIEGDDDALAAIRDETRAFHGCDDISDDALVYLWMDVVVMVAGADNRQYPVPPATQVKFLEARPHPKTPIARIPATAPEAAPLLTKRDELLSSSKPAEGNPGTFAKVREITRLYHEVISADFCEDGEVRWFLDGLYIMGPGNNPLLFQVPMNRIADMVYPREFPLLPYLVMPAANKPLN